MNNEIISNLTMLVKHDKFLRHLSLQGMHLSLAVETDRVIEEKDKASAQMLSRFKNTIAKQIQETVTSVELNPHQQFGVLIHAISSSSSIQSVHLSDNGFDDF